MRPGPGSGEPRPSRSEDTENLRPLDWARSISQACIVTGEDTGGYIWNGEMRYNCWFSVIVGCSVAPSSQQHHDFERSFIASNENTRRKEAAGVIEGENEWLFLKKADNCGAWLDDTICKGWMKLSFRGFSLVITNNPDFQLVRRGAGMREGVPMPNDGHESGISDVTWCDNLDVPPYNPGHHNPSFSNLDVKWAARVEVSERVGLRIWHLQWVYVMG